MTLFETIFPLLSLLIILTLYGAILDTQNEDGLWKRYFDQQGKIVKENKEEHGHF